VTLGGHLSFYARREFLEPCSCMRTTFLGQYWGLMSLLDWRADITCTFQRRVLLIVGEIQKRGGVRSREWLLWYRGILFISLVAFLQEENEEGQHRGCLLLFFCTQAAMENKYAIVYTVVDIMCREGCACAFTAFKNNRTPLSAHLAWNMSVSTCVCEYRCLCTRSNEWKRKDALVTERRGKGRRWGKVWKWEWEKRCGCNQHATTRVEKYFLIVYATNEHYLF